MANVMEIPELVFFRGDHRLLHFPIDRAELCIGSHPTSDVVVPDASIPEVAALLMDRGARRFRLRDLTGGTLTVNGQSLDGEECDLGPGDAVHIGPFSLCLRIKEEDVARPRPGTTRVLTELGENMADTETASEATVTCEGQRFVLGVDRPFNIGGHEDNDLRIDDPFVSAFHCRITRQHGHWALVDLNSTNGTEVNGLRVREAELPTPATVRIGRTFIMFDVGGTSAQGDVAAGDVEAFHGMIACSNSMRRVFDLTTRLASAKEPVLITGASGSGKELVARALHAESSRSGGPYLAINCGALTSSLVESELFGHVKGAFTGATSDKPGAFEAASNGTLFLDEIGELALDLQPKLLRVLESSTVRRVGGTHETKVSTRVVAATHRNLEELVEEGKFREDLFHRLYVLSIHIPKLAERPEDIVPLARHFMRTQAPREIGLARDAEAALLGHAWPGNIRELRNVIVRAILLTDADTIHAADLQFSTSAFAARSQDARGSVRRHDERERDRLLEALDRAGGNRAEAARILGVSKSTFHDRLKRHGVPLKFGGRALPDED